jgi:hypothetical protein
MAALLYWIVYNFDLGPLGPTMLDAAVQSWLKRAKSRAQASNVRRRISSFLTTFNPQLSLRTDERV